MLQILHFSDLHLGAKFSGLGKAGDKIRLQLKNTFSKILDTAVSKKVDLILCAGDLFDSNQISRTTLEFVVKELSRIKKIPVVIIPGTHDYLDEYSIYRSFDSEEISKNVFVFNDEKERSKTFEDLELTIYAKPIKSKTGKEKPLSGLKIDDSTKYHIAMAHGSLIHSGKSAENDFPIHTSEIESSGFDYIALGHSHSYQDASTDEVKACYPGSAEQLGFGIKDSGNVLLVTIDGRDVEVEKIKVGELSWKETKLNLDDFSSGAKLQEEIEKHKSESSLLKVIINGDLKLGKEFDSFKLQKGLEDAFLYLQIEDQTGIPSEEGVYTRSPAHTITGQYVRVMQGKIKNASQSQRRKLEAALKLGYELLNGEEEI